MFDHRQIRRAFARAAPGYSAFAALQAEVESRLLEQLDAVAAAPARALDLGSGPGKAAAAIKRQWPRAQVLALDIALPMLHLQRQGWWKPAARRIERVCADARALPLADASLDLLFSNLCLQWVDDLPATLDGFRRVLRPDGLLLFSTFVDDTLWELRQAFAEADPGRPHVSGFLPLQTVGDALLAAGFRDPVLHVDRFHLDYAEPMALLRELHGLGAGNAMADRRRGLTGKQRMRAALAAYPRIAGQERIVATYDVAYVQAFAPQPGQPRRLGGADVVGFPVESLRRRKPQPPT